MSTLGEIKAAGQWIVLYCESFVGVRWCNHSHTPSMDQLIQYFGVDYDLLANRAQFLARFECEECGGQKASLQIGRPPDGKNGGIPTAYVTPYISVAEATRLHLEFTAKQKRLGIKSSAEINAEARATLKAKKQAEQGEGPLFIGPPDPRKLWKRKPPRMKQG